MKEKDDLGPVDPLDVDKKVPDDLSNQQDQQHGTGSLPGYGTLPNGEAATDDGKFRNGNIVIRSEVMFCDQSFIHL